MSNRRVSVVCTVLNEADSLDGLLASLEAQTRQPDEIIVVDGGSTDGTWERLRAWSSSGPDRRAVLLPGAGISEGRNLAIREASGEIIAVTDAGVCLAPGWLAALVAPFESAEAPAVVSGFFLAGPQSTWELSLGATTLPSLEEVDPDRFLPSSRSVAFLKSAWRKARGYPEWLDYCEDLVFDLALKRANLRFGWAPDAIAYFRPRPDARRFFLQYYRYARGDGKALLWTRRHLVRYGVYVGAPLLLWGSRTHGLAITAIILGGLAYCWRPLLRLRPGLGPLPWPERVLAIALVPAIRAIGDVGKMTGYPVGLWWRWRQRREAPWTGRRRKPPQ